MCIGRGGDEEGKMLKDRRTKDMPVCVKGGEGKIRGKGSHGYYLFIIFIFKLSSIIELETVYMEFTSSMGYPSSMMQIQGGIPWAPKTNSI